MSQDQCEQAGMCQVIKAYQAENPDPIAMSVGDTLTVSKEEPWNDNPDWVWILCTNQQGKSSWVPQGYVERTSAGAQALRDYDAVELTAAEGETLSAGQIESGWAWCTNAQGKSGWVPLDNLAWM